MGPSIESVYDDRSTAMVVLVVIIAILFLLALILLYLWLSNRSKHKKEQSKSKPVANETELTESELQVISEYRKLDSKEKDLIKTTLQTLNKKR